MPTFWSQTLIPTLRQVPGEAEVPSHKLMLRAGLIRRLGSGVYDYLPLGLRSLRKAMQIVREEMDAAGAAEVMLPSLQPIELWERTGRREAYGENLFVLTDRHERQQALGPTHEEVITELVGGCVSSYKDLPLTLYQIQTKFRDEFRPRFGVLRSREFQMKDAYSFHTNLEGPGGLDETYQKQYEAYRRIFQRCGIPFEVVEAESGPIGGQASHEFMVPSPTGEDVILKSEAGDYAANVEKCQIGARPVDLQAEPIAEPEEVITPNCPGIDSVVEHFKKELKTKLKPSNMLKTLVFRVERDEPPEGVDRGPEPKDFYALAVVRGDHEVNEAKLRGAIEAQFAGVACLEMTNEWHSYQGGFSIGFVGPHVAVGRKDIYVFVDPDAAQGGFWVTGANRPDYHLKGFNWKRELGHEDQARFEAIGHRAVYVADLRNAVEGDPSPKNDGSKLIATRGIEIGHVFKLGTKYTEALDVRVLDEQNQRVPVLMGCYGIGVNRILAAAIEREGGHDDNGIVWPVSLAPYRAVVTAVRWEGQVAEAAMKLAEELEAKGVDVLIDDRDERPGPKFKDADLIGIPLRLVVGEKGLKDGKIELKPRTAKDAEMVDQSAAADRAVALLGDASGES